LKITILKTILIAVCVLVLAGCQNGPRLDPDKTALKIPPLQSQYEAGSLQRYLWGGEILEINNLEQSTELTILSYPLDSYEKPKYKANSTGRFIAVYNGFLEPTDFSRGKLVTVLGRLAAPRDGSVNQAPYQFPVLDINQISLKGRPTSGYGIPISIGVGIGF